MTVQDNSAVVRRFTAGLRAGDVAGCLELLDDEIVFSEAASLPFGGEYLGKDGFVQLLRKVDRDFQVELDPPEIGDAGPFVAVRMHGTMTSRVTGRGLPMKVVDLYRLRGDKIVRVDVFYQDSHAVSELCRGDTTAAHRPSDHQGATT